MKKGRNGVLEKNQIKFPFCPFEREKKRFQQWGGQSAKKWLLFFFPLFFTQQICTAFWGRLKRRQQIVFQWWSPKWLLKCAAVHVFFSANKSGVLKLGLEKTVPNLQQIPIPVCWLHLHWIKEVGEEVHWRAIEQQQQQQLTDRPRQFCVLKKAESGVFHNIKMLKSAQIIIIIIMRASEYNT